MDKKYLFKNFLKDKHIGSIVSSSRFAVDRICKKLDFSGRKVIVEYGPGTGVFTRMLLERMGPASKLILIETNKEMISILRQIRDPRVFIFNDTAENVEEILHQCGEETADYVISGIPFSFIKKEDKHKILGNTRKVLASNGSFVVYQYTLTVLGYLRKYFRQISYDFVFLNIPPLFVFEAFK